MSLQAYQKKKNFMISARQSQQHRISDQEDSAFQSSQDYNQMMNSQENSQGSSFDLFSQMMSQQQGLSQQNETAPSHRFYTKYMSKAPLFSRESSQNERNPLPRRRSYQDLQVQEANRQRAKDRDDRDLINTFIALVKECADEIKSTADDIKSNVDRGIKESANKSANLMKKINEDLSEHYNTLLDSIKEKETERSKIAELEQELATKEARIEVLESQLEVANAAKDEHVVQSIVEAYKEQQKISRDHMDKIHKEQQKFTKEQVEIIKKQQQEKVERSHSVEFSEKQPSKNLELISSAESDSIHSVHGTKLNDVRPCVQPPYSSTANNQASDIHTYNMAGPTGMPQGMPTTIPAVQPIQQYQVTSQIPTQQATNLATCCDQRCSSRGFCIDCEYNLPQCSSSSALSFQPVSITASNVNQSTCNASSYFPPPQYQQHYERPDVSISTMSQHPIQRQTLPARQSSSLKRNVQSSNAVFYTLTSPIPDHPTASLWSKANRLKPSPVATVAPQVKNESLSPEHNAGDIQEIDNSNQKSQEIQQRRSRRSASSMQVSKLQPRRHSARVQARNTMCSSNGVHSDIQKTFPNMTRPKIQKIQQEKKNQKQALPQSKRVPTNLSCPSRKNKTSNAKQQNQEEMDIYEFEEEAAQGAPPVKKLKTRSTIHIKSSSNKSKQRLQYRSNSNYSDYVKQHQGQSGFSRAYPDYETQPKQNIFKKSHPQYPKSSDQWIFQDSGSAEYNLEDESEISDELSQEKIQLSGKIKDPTQKYASRTSLTNYYEDDEESSEEISFSLEPPARALYPYSKTSGNVKQQLPAVAADFLSTPCLQPTQYDSEDSQQISGYTSAPGSSVRRKISRQSERKRRLQAMVRQTDASSTLAEISKSISKHRSKLKRSTSLLSVC